MSSNDKSGGSAFPRLELKKREDGAAIMVAVEGMSLRAWYAGMAMKGMLASSSVWGSAVFDNPDRCAKWAFGFADAMIAEGEK